MIFQVELFSRGTWRRTPMAFGSESAANTWIADRGANWRVRAVAAGFYTPPRPTKEFLNAEAAPKRSENRDPRRQTPRPGHQEHEPLPDADAWKWTCHRCGYFVESVDEEEMRALRAEHLSEERRKRCERTCELWPRCACVDLVHAP